VARRRAAEQSVNVRFLLGEHSHRDDGVRHLRNVIGPVGIAVMQGLWDLVLSDDVFVA